MVVSDNDRQALRELAKRYREIADSPEMPVRKQQWKDLHDLKPQKPMIMFEPYWLDGYLADYEPKCEDQAFRNIELGLMFKIRQYEQMGDDIVIEPYFRLGWQGKDINSTGRDFGEIQIVEDHAIGGGLAYKSVFPIKTPDDIKRLTPRTFEVKREPVLKMKSVLDDIFGDILPVIIGNFDNFDPDLGNQPFVGNNFIGVTWDTFKLIGAEAMMLWPYDYPDAIPELLAFLVDDKKRFYNYMQDEGLLASNTDTQFAGPSTYGYVSGLPENKTEGVLLKDVWAWSESQETEMMSPEMFDEIYLPAMAELANMFGLIYYGCCERVDSKIEYLLKRIPNIRTFSCSGWSDVDAMAEKLGNKYVLSKKPVPGVVSTPTPEWEKVKDEAERTWAAVKRNGTPLAVICRDVYSSVTTPARAVEWVRVWKDTLGI